MGSDRRERNHLFRKNDADTSFRSPRRHKKYYFYISLITKKPIPFKFLQLFNLLIKPSDLMSQVDFKARFL